MASELGASENPRTWRFTWEAQSHITTLKLLLFNPYIIPSTHCKKLKVQLIPEQSLLRVNWVEAEAEVFLNVPIPRVLVDAEAPLQFRGLDDHLEVKLVLLLPVDHPILTDFDCALSLSEDDTNRGKVLSSDSRPLSMDVDVKNLSSSTEGVNFYCRSCSALLTRSIRSFTEMPSTNWREAADNWFGAGCCSFGGISEKLVARYANSYAPKMGICLLSTTFIAISRDDLVGCNFPCGVGNKSYDNVADIGDIKFSGKNVLDNGGNDGRGACCVKQKESVVGFSDPREDNLTVNLESQVPEKVTNGENLSDTLQALRLSDDVLSTPGCCRDGTHNLACVTENSFLETSGTSPMNHKPVKRIELPENLNIFLNGFLGDVFMSRSFNLTKDVLWVEYYCPQCSSLLGAYPAGNGPAPLDGGVRLFKCYVSTCLPAGGSNDLFRKYTLERMFANQLVENAKSELSYRTIVRDLQTMSAMLQIVLLNPNCFLSSGYCSSSDNKMEATANVDLSSAIKLLFLDCSGISGSQKRMVEEWGTKNQADEVYMLAGQIEKLIKILHLAKENFPLSCTSLQGLSLSSMWR